MPARHIATQRVYTRLELDGGIVKVTRPLCTPLGSTRFFLITEAKIVTYLRLCVLRRVCRTANATGAGGRALVVREITGLFAMFWANHFGSLDFPLFRKDSDALLILGTWKGAYTTGVFSRLLPLRLRRGHRYVVRLLDVESD